MALRSWFFRSTPKLERAAIDDAAHVAKGSVGDHVRKIQIALNVLDGMAITEDGIYGPKNRRCCIGI
jgi:peptidoglycan hydrolase-like protein with peptidoglycan-binding domain